MIFQDIFFFNYFVLLTVDLQHLLVSGVHQSDSVLFFFSRNFPIIEYYKVLSIVSCAI